MKEKYLSQNMLINYQGDKKLPLTPRIELTPDEKEEFYILSITSTDTPGLLYKVARILASYKISIHSQKSQLLAKKLKMFFSEKESLLKRNRNHQDRNRSMRKFNIESIYDHRITLYPNESCLSKSTTYPHMLL